MEASKSSRSRFAAHFCFARLRKTTRLKSVIIPAVKTTRYFEEQVLRKRPYLRREWCESVIKNPLKREVQPNGGLVPDLHERALRVVTLQDGETVHNAFPDRNFKLP